MALRVDVWTDFSTASSFLTTLHLEKLSKNHSLDIRWHSFMVPFSEAGIAQSFSVNEHLSKNIADLAKLEYGAELRPALKNLNSRSAHLVEKYAEARGKGKEFHLAAMKAFWIESRSLESEEVLSDLLNRIGLKGERVSRILKDHKISVTLGVDIELADAYGLEEAPAAIFDQRFLVSGAQPFMVFERVLGKFAS